MLATFHPLHALEVPEIPIQPELSNVFYDLTFDADTPGDPPSISTVGATVGQVSTKPSALVNPGNSSLNVRSNYQMSNGNLGRIAGDQVLELHDQYATGADVVLKLRIAEHNAPDSGILTLRWDMLIDSTSSEPGMLHVEAYNHLGVNDNTSQTKVALGYNGEQIKASQGTVLTDTGKLTPTDEIVHCEWQIDLDRNTHTLYYQTDSGPVVASQDFDTHELWRVMLMRFTSPETSKGKVALDNIKMRWTPPAYLVNTTYDDQDAGSALGTQTYAANTTLALPQHVTDPINPPALTVEDQYKDTTSNIILGPENEHVLVCKDASDSNGHIFWNNTLHVDNRPTQGKYMVSWRMLIDSGATRAGDIMFQMRSSDHTQRARLYFTKDQTVALGQDDVSAQVISNYTFTTGVVHHVQWELDLDANTQTLYVDGDLVGSFPSLADANDGDNDLASLYFYSLDKTKGTCALGEFRVHEITDAPVPASIRAINLPLNLSNQTLDEWKKWIDRSADAGYNAVVFTFAQGGTILKTTGAIENDKATFEYFKVDPLFSDGLSGDEAMTNLIQYIRDKDMEPIVSITAIQKLEKVLADLHTNPEDGGTSYPGVYMAEGDSSDNFTMILNPDFVFPFSSGDKSIYDVVVYPLIDKIISLYDGDPPRYLLVNTDEADVDILHNHANNNSNYADAGEVYAELVNKITSYLVDQKDITPIIWGDMLLSYNLGKSNHVVSGFPHDPRFMYKAHKDYDATGYSYSPAGYHGEFHADNDLSRSTISAINHLTNKDKIIVADWQYFAFTNMDDNDKPQYPSFDYFLRMGFADVWGATFYEEKAQKAYSTYSRDHVGGGMMATIWGAMNTTSTWDATGFQWVYPILYNSIVYFDNPDFDPPTVDDTTQLELDWKINSASKGDTSVIVLPTRKPVPHVTLPTGVIAADVNSPTLIVFDQYTSDSSNDRRPIKYYDLIGQGPYDIESTTVNYSDATQNNPVAMDVLLSYQDPDTGYLVSRWIPNSFILAHSTPPMLNQFTQADNTIMDVPLTLYSPASWKERLFQAQGTDASKSLIVARGPIHSNANPTQHNHHLNMNWFPAVYQFPTPTIVDSLTDANGFTVEVDFKYADDLPASNASLLSWGFQLEGFRLLLRNNGHVAIQFARGDRQVGQLITANAWEVTANQLCTAKVEYNPTASPHGSVTLTVTQVGQTGENTITVNLEQPFVVPVSHPIGYGYECGSGYVNPFDLNSAAWQPIDCEIERVRWYD